MKRAGAFVALVLLAAAHGSVARADGGDAADLQGILDQPVVTAASKAAESDAVAPATTTVITSEELRRYGMHTVGEALTFLSMGVVGESPQGLDADELGARGVTITGDVGSHFLVLVNGHPINSQVSGATQLNSNHGENVWFSEALGVPLEMVDHIEVMLGPGSVLYGSNAMLGIVDVVTKSADAFHGGHAVVESELTTTARGFLGVGEELSLFGSKAEITAGVQGFTQRGPDATFTPQHLAGNQVWGGTAHNIGRDVPSAVLHLGLGNLEVNGRATLVNATTPLVGFGATSFDQPNAYARERALSADARYRIPVSPVFELTASGYFDDGDFQAYYTYASPTDISSAAKSYVVRGNVQGSFDWLQNGKLVTLLGAEALYVRASELVMAVDGPTIESIVTHMTHDNAPLAAYAQQTWQPGRGLAFNGGVRVDYDQRFDAVASPRLAAALSPWSDATMKLIYSEAFRAPTLNESYETWTGSRIAPTNLVPERVRSVEMSLQQNFGAQHLRFGVFYSDWRDLIYLHSFTTAETAAGIGPAGYSQIQNRGSISNPGYNGSFDGSLDGGNLRYGLTVTGALANVGGGDTLPVAPNVFGNAHLSYDLPGDWPVLAFAGYFIGPRRAAVPFQSSANPDSLPQVSAQVALRPTVSGPVPGVRGLTYRASANFVIASDDPYLVGPLSVSSPNASQLVPVEKFRSTVGLQYDF